MARPIPVGRPYGWAKMGLAATLRPLPGLPGAAVGVGVGWGAMVSVGSRAMTLVALAALLALARWLRASWISSVVWCFVQ